MSVQIPPPLLRGPPRRASCFAGRLPLGQSLLHSTLEPAWIRQRRGFVRPTSKQVVAFLCTGSAACGDLRCSGGGRSDVGFQAQTAAPATCQSPTGSTAVQSVRLLGRPGFIFLTRDTSLGGDCSVASRPWGAAAAGLFGSMRAPVKSSGFFGWPSILTYWHLSLARSGPRARRGFGDTGDFFVSIPRPDAVWTGGADVFSNGHSENGRCAVRVQDRSAPKRRRAPGATPRAGNSDCARWRRTLTLVGGGRGAS